MARTECPNVGIYHESMGVEGLSFSTLVGDRGILRSVTIGNHRGSTTVLKSGDHIDDFTAS